MIKKNFLKDIRYFDDDREIERAFNTLEEKKIVEYNAETNTLTVNLDMKIKVKGTLEFDVDEHVLISSGKGTDPNRDDGVKYSIWLNPSLDEDKKPVAMLDTEDEWQI